MPDYLPSVAPAIESPQCASSERHATTLTSGAAPRLLCVHKHEPSWVLLTVGLNTVGLAPPRLVWVSTAKQTLAKLREEQFDCLLIDAPAGLSVPGDGSGPFALIRALRTGGCAEPVVLVARLLTDSEWNEACACDCDVFLSPRGWESTALGSVVKRALLRGQMARENRSLTAANHARLVRERDESEQLLAHQRQLIAELESLPHPLRQTPFHGSEPIASTTIGSRSVESPDVQERSQSTDDAFAADYAGLLRSYVLIGSGSLANEIAGMADRLVTARVPPPEALQLHLGCVESLVKGLGNRSARHVMARADLLAVEMMTHLAHRSQRLAGAAAASETQAVVPLRNVNGSAGIDLTQLSGSER